MRRALACTLLVSACGRVDFNAIPDADSDAGSACVGSNVVFCDNFQRSVAIPAGDPTWASSLCDPTATLTVDDLLDIQYPASAAGNDQCELISYDGPATSSFQLEFDAMFSFAQANTDAVTVAQLVVFLPAPNGDGIDTQQTALLVGGDTGANVTVVYHYPNASQSPEPGNNYPGYDVADSHGTSWYTPGQWCHITANLDIMGASGSASATCDGTTSSMLPHANSNMATGVSGAPNLYVGFALPNMATPAWHLQYKNLVLRTVP